MTLLDAQDAAQRAADISGVSMLVYKLGCGMYAYNTAHALPKWGEMVGDRVYTKQAKAPIRTHLQNLVDALVTLDSAETYLFNSNATNLREAVLVLRAASLELRRYIGFQIGATVNEDTVCI